MHENDWNALLYRQIASVTQVQTQSWPKNINNNPILALYAVELNSVSGISVLEAMEQSRRVCVKRRSMEKSSAGS